MRSAIVAFSILLAACSSEDDGTGRQQPALVCAPGKSESCLGPAGCQGGQVCNDQGTAWGECVCGSTGDEGGSSDAASEPDVADRSCTGSCAGVCIGSCQGTCSAVQNDGSCAGTCSGDCSGECVGTCSS